jgi:hypothetical protein
MTRTDLPLLLLAEPVAKRQSPQSRLKFADAAFLLTVATVLVGGCLLLLNLGSAQSSGQAPVDSHFFGDLLAALPALLATLGKYVLLALACILNSALIVALVYSLRSLDLKVRRKALRASFGATPLRKAQNVRQPQAKAVRQEAAAQSYLLSPVFR